MNIQFHKLTKPTEAIREAFDRWENDPALISLTRPNQSQADIELTKTVSFEDLTERVKDHHIYLIYLDGQLVGEMNYMIDPPHLFKKVPQTAWIGITIGEAEARGKGIGRLSIKHLEKEIEQEGLRRIELGVFEFNESAFQLYKKMGYQEIGRIKDFTFCKGKLWADIRMEKHVKGN
ncbi:GNAT family N-acetyltransferase [Halobacillus mangrovi]|uniref:GNAT family N-acetyltransferase n=1 Tax=Halobacillus mangrovi TaxID=402384 RepID=A0A1W5ZXC6_9BACI|nr:GNAT family N-acetyltransferase [Halobacillus mangrovi]ARI77901.1 GNAT family N-acetyltransferase [Halobacillus mangrovi]